jgi:hypothetical protein
MSECATALSTAPSNTPSNTPSNGSQTQPSGGGTSPITHFPFETALSHKVLAPVSIALLLPGVLVFRLASPSFHVRRPTEKHIALVYSSALIILIAYGAGVAGLATSFTTFRSGKPSSSSIALKTTHGKAGLVLFVGLYVLIPVFLLLPVCLRRSRESPDQKSEKSTTTRPRIDSGDTTEVRSSNHLKSASQSVNNPSPPSSPRPRVHSWGPMSLWPRNHDAPITSDNESVLTAPVTRGFEVSNRPAQTRRPRTASNSWLAAAAAAELRRSAPVSGPSTNLGDINWLQRRRSLNALV